MLQGPTLTVDTGSMANCSGISSSLRYFRSCYIQGGGILRHLRDEEVSSGCSLFRSAEWMRHVDYQSGGNDHGSCDTVIRVLVLGKLPLLMTVGTSPLCGIGVHSLRGAPIPKEMQERVQELYQLKYDCCSWIGCWTQGGPPSPRTFRDFRHRAETTRCMFLPPGRRELLRATSR